MEKFTYYKGDRKSKHTGATLASIAFAFLSAYSITSHAQTINIDHGTQRYLGDVSELDRAKYFTIHSTASDAELNRFYADYNVTKGRQFWGPYSFAKSRTGAVGQYPANKNGPAGVRQVLKGVVSTEHPGNVIRYNLDRVKGANWAVEYFKDYVANGQVPEIFEPMNEPFVHATDAIYKEQQPDGQKMKESMADWFAEVGKQIDQSPELANMKVIGYSSAWPSLELWNFGHWNNNQKMFMDRAGDHMDGFATHLYDGINVTGQDNFRSGSNSEAILDMIEAYSYIKWGVVKPHAITEYGGIERGYGPGFSDIANAQALRSFNHMVFNLLERENDMLISIPFITDKSPWHLTAANNYQPYGAVLFKPKNIGQPNPGGWEYTPRIHFYELWKEFKGQRVDIKSDNPDIQVQAFASGDKLYVAANNIDTLTQNVGLNFIDGLSGLESVRIKSLKVFGDRLPELRNVVQATAPASISLISGETVTLEYTFDSNIAFDNAVRKTKYYTNKYLTAIKSGQSQSYTFQNIKTGSGRAAIRMTLGRKTNASKAPIVTVNGTRVSVPTNWTGYNQDGRDDFFGTIVVPFESGLLAATTTVTVEFPDNGGHVASMILEVENYDTPPVVEEQQRPFNGVPAGIPGRIEIEDFDLGGQGVAYNDVDASNNGGQVYRPNEGVDIQARDGGRIVGWTRDGEWVEYTVNAERGTYDIDFRISTQSLTQYVVVKLDDVEIGRLDLPNTESWDNFQTVTLSKIKLDGGSDSVLRLEFFGGGAAYNWVQFNKLELPAETVSCEALPASIETGNTLDVTLGYSANESREVTAELWRGSTWLAEAEVAVGEGAGSANLRFNLAEPLTPNSDYQIKGGIRPVGSTWRENINGCIKSNIVLAPPAKEAVSCGLLSDSYEVSRSLSLPVEYSVNQQRDVVAELWNGSTYVAENRLTVSPGSGVADIPLTFNLVPTPGKNYLVKAQVREVGAGWQNPVDACNKGNIAMISCDLPWTRADMSISKETVNWASDPINIDCATGVSISMDIEGLTPQVMEAADYLNIFYSVDGGEKIAISRNTDGFALKTISASNITGSSLVLYVEAKTSWQDETYNVRNIRIQKMP